jgi:phenylalanyl-tRNA synthetase alpha chain
VNAVVTDLGVIVDQTLSEIARAADLNALEQIRVRLLGKSGVITEQLKSLGGLPAAARPSAGQRINEAKQSLGDAIQRRRAELERANVDAALAAGHIDVTLPGRGQAAGGLHPVTKVRLRMEALFRQAGFRVAEGPEVEDDFHNFEALNMPPDHPARDMQDTLYLAAPVIGGTWGAHRYPVLPPDQRGAARRMVPEAQVRAATLLRTHTSAMQIRYMKTFPPPVRIIVPGRVYRRDNLDLTHTPMFQQFEGLVVGPGVTMADLKGTFDAMVTALFGDVKIRLRPSFFPYTEPSAEVDISCHRCGGSGCSICKQTGWLEILGSGMVHPAVFEAVGYDPEQVTGFAFGLGLERIAMLKYGVDDIRLFYENDLRFLGQFPAP